MNKPKVDWMQWTPFGIAFAVTGGFTLFTLIKGEPLEWWHGLMLLAYAALPVARTIQVGILRVEREFKELQNETEKCLIEVRHRLSQRTEQRTEMLHSHVDKVIAGMDPKRYLVEVSENRDTFRALAITARDCDESVQLSIREHLDDCAGALIINDFASASRHLKEMKRVVESFPEASPGRDELLEAIDGASSTLSVRDAVRVEPALQEMEMPAESMERILRKILRGKD